MRASQVIEVLENNDNFVTTLNELNIGKDVKIFIYYENILPQIQSCAMIVGKYEIDGFKGFLGLLGSTRMKYPFNHAMVQKVLELLKK